MSTRRNLDSNLFLEIVRHDHSRDRALGQRNPASAIDQVSHLRRFGRHVHVLAGDVLVQADQIDLLLVVAAEPGPRLLTDDRHHRLMVELGVVEPVQQVYGAWTQVARQTPSWPVNLA